MDIIIYFWSFIQHILQQLISLLWHKVQKAFNFQTFLICPVSSFGLRQGSPSMQYWDIAGPVSAQRTIITARWQRPCRAVTPHSPDTFPPSLCSSHMSAVFHMDGGLGPRFILIQRFHSQVIICLLKIICQWILAELSAQQATSRQATIVTMKFMTLQSPPPPAGSSLVWVIEEKSFAVDE